MYNVIKGVTRVDLNRGTCTLIDHILVNLPKVKTFSAIVESDISDHYSTLYGVYDHPPEENDTHLQPTIMTSKVNQLIRATDWTQVAERNDPVSLLSSFIEKMSEIYLSSKSTHRKRSRKNVPWITRDIQDICRERDRLYRRWKSNRNNLTYEREYKTLRNQVNKKIALTRNQYYKNKFEEVRSDPKKTWALINEVLGRKKLNLDDVIRNSFSPNVSTAQLADELGDLFSKQAATIIHTCNIAESTHRNAILRDSIYLGDISCTEVSNLLYRLNVQKAPGADGIRALDLRSNADIFTPIIAKLINLSFDTSTVPEKLKEAVVRPIHKGGSKKQLENYRPIAVLPAIEKIMEQIVSNRIWDFIHKHDLISKHQYGFQKGRSTNQLLGDFANVINTSLSKRHHTLVLFLDFSKAFDTLDHNKLIDAVQRVGIRGKLAYWIADYLAERTFRVRVKDCCSRAYRVQYGVPQGSKLGPLLFILYTNELLKCFKKSFPFAYADDTAIVVCHQSLEEAARMMQAEFDEAGKWCHDNGLVINATKTKLMHIRSPNYSASQVLLKSYRCANASSCEDIQMVDTYKYLGITIDCHFLWDAHVNDLRNKLKGSLFALACLQYKSTTSVQKQVYYALIESRLRYGVLAWGGAAQTHIEKLQQIQDRALKLMSKGYVSTNNVRVLKVRQIFEMSAVLEYYDDPSVRTPITHQVNTRRRAEGLLQLPAIINEYGRRRLNYIVPNVLNNLPQHLRNLNPINVRKRKIKQYFLESIT